MNGRVPDARKALGTALVAFALAVWPLSAGSLADAGFDSSYAGESAFLTLSPGQSGDFSVFFFNTGSTTWTRGSTSQVDLAACQSDQVTCDAVPTLAAWNPGGTSGWRSSTRYAAQTQATVAAGSIGTFRYTVQAPSSAAAGTYTFSGDLVVSTSGAKVHPEGYFQAVQVTGAPAAPTPTPAPTPAPTAAIKPTLASAASQNLTQVTLTFSRSMSCASLAAGTYVIRDANATIVDQTLTSGNQITVQSNSATGAGASDCSTATLYMRESNSSSLLSNNVYTVQVTGVTDPVSTPIDASASSASFRATGTTPSATSAAFLSATVVRVVFNVPMLAGGGNGITYRANYSFDGTAGVTAFTSCVSSAAGSGADCTLTTTPAAGQHTLQVTQVTDPLGNAISPDPTSLTLSNAVTTKRPTALSAVSSTSTQAIVTFDTTMATAGQGSCASASNYNFQNADGTTSGLSASVASCSSNQATLTLSGATSGKAYAVVLTGLTDPFGSLINPNPTTLSFTAGGSVTTPLAVSATVPSVALACDVTSPAPCQRSQFTVQFSEPMSSGSGTTGTGNTALYTLKDPTGVAATISSCTAVDGRNVTSAAYVTCALSRPVAAGTYMLTVGNGTGPVDVIANVLKAATFNLIIR